MTDDDILRMAIECQLVTTGNREGIYSEALMRFARMAMQHEREECAKLCDKLEQQVCNMWHGQACAGCAATIRARGEA
jgi:hypothetical protein